jgi:hypothetical protein
VLRGEASRHCRNKREYVDGKINELQTDSKNNNVRDLYRDTKEIKNGYEPRTNIVTVR